MKVGVPREIKDQESRVALTPEGARDLVDAGHEVLVESEAGQASSFPNDDYVQAGATLIPDAADVWGDADLIVKVKEPLESEFRYMRAGLTLFTYLHLAANLNLAHALTGVEMTALGYETVELRSGYLPLLAPMSEIAGRQATQIAAHYLEAPAGGKGKLLGGIPGVAPAEVVILGAGNVGRQSARVAVGAGARVTIMDLRLDRLRSILELLPEGSIATSIAAPGAVAKAVERADVVIGATHSAGSRTPQLVTREMVRSMAPLSVIVDVAVDQGGTAETIHATTHSDPVYIEEGVIHYGVANMPGAVPNTATYALCNATLPYILELANYGVAEAAERDAALERGINVFGGKMTNAAAASAVGLESVSLAEAGISLN